MTEEKYTYYRMDFKNCSSIDFDYTICDGLHNVNEYLELVDIDLDDPDSNAVVEIRGVGLTRKEYDDFIEDLKI